MLQPQAKTRIQIEQEERTLARQVQRSKSIKPEIRRSITLDAHRVFEFVDFAAFLHSRLGYSSVAQALQERAKELARKRAVGVLLSIMNQYTISSISTANMKYNLELLEVENV